MLIRLENPKNKRTIFFGSKQEFVYFFGNENYKCNIDEYTLSNNSYVLKASPTGFFDNLRNNPQTQKGANEDGSTYVSDFKDERILTWQFNNAFGVLGQKSTWDYFSSVFNIKNQLLNITTFWLNPSTNEVIESRAKCYSTNNTSFEAGEVQVVLDGNGLWERGLQIFKLSPFDGTILPYLYYENGTTLGAVYTSDGRKAPFGISSQADNTIQIENITANTPIRITVTATQIVNFEAENLQTGVFSKVSGAYNSSEIVIDSQIRDVKINNVSDLTNFSGGFIFLIEGTNVIRFNNIVQSSQDLKITVEVFEYANSISG